MTSSYDSTLRLHKPAKDCSQISQAGITFKSGLMKFASVMFPPLQLFWCFYCLEWWRIALSSAKISLLVFFLITHLHVLLFLFYFRVDLIRKYWTWPLQISTVMIMVIKCAKVLQIIPLCYQVPCHLHFYHGIVDTAVPIQYFGYNRIWVL